MEASRLVFVSLKNSKPRRKVAIPLPDTYTYEQFAEKVKHKLKLLSVGEITQVSTGERVTNVDDIQDIDELQVEEAATDDIPYPTPNGSAPYDDALRSEGASSSAADSLLGGGPDRMNSMATGSSAPSAVLRSQPSRAMSYAADDMGMGGDDEDSKKKYVKRNAGVVRKLQRLFPSLFSPGLPVSTKDVDGSGVRRKRSRSYVDPRNFLVLFALLSCLATMLLLYSRVAAA